MKYFRFGSWTYRRCIGIRIWFIEEYNGIGASIACWNHEYAVYFNPSGDWGESFMIDERIYNQETRKCECDEPFPCVFPVPVTGTECDNCGGLLMPDEGNKAGLDQLNRRLKPN